LHGKRLTLSPFNAESAAALAGPQWLLDRRVAGHQAFEGSTMPSESEEVWRYTPINEFKLDEFSPDVAAAGASPAAGQALLASVVSSIGPVSGTVLVHNGHPGTFEGGGSFGFGGTATVDGASSVLGGVLAGGDSFVRLNDAFMSDAVIIDVPAGVEVPHPIVVVHWCDAGSSGTAFFPRLSVRVGRSAQASVIELFAGPADGGRVLVVPVTELDAADNANLSYVSMQTMSESVWSIARLAGRGGADSTVRTFTVGLGGDYDRVRTDVTAVGKGAHSNILSAYLGNDTQVHDVRTLQEHVAPRTTSELLCKGAVAGSSRSVYSGLIRVHRGAIRTEARQTNHNLVLDELAHADSVPNLDILENDVKCSHASTVGPIDEDQRYYIESRGVSPDVAEGLIVGGFFNDILSRSPIPAVTPLLTSEVHTRLQQIFSNRRETADV
jgi:Fe-S cluster assembly protein SufD